MPSIVWSSVEPTEHPGETGVAYWRTQQFGELRVRISNPDGMAITVFCVDPGTIASVETRCFDGQNWEDNAARLAHKSKD